MTEKGLDIISFTERGIRLSLVIGNVLSEGGFSVRLHTGCSRFDPEKRRLQEETGGPEQGKPAHGGHKAVRPFRESDVKKISVPVREWTGQIFRKSGGLIMIGAMGIAVRAIAPYVSDKLTDIPVIVADEAGRFVIPVLSGHYGGAGTLASFIAAEIGSELVMTTATDVNQVFAVDVFARENRFLIGNRDGIKAVSGALLAGEKVGLTVEGGIKGELPGGLLLLEKPGEIREPGDSEEQGASGEPGVSGEPGASGEPERAEVSAAVHVGIHIPQELSVKEEEVRSSGEDKEAAEQAGPESSQKKVLHLIPRTVHLGMGCRRGVPKEELEQAVLAVLSKEGIDRRAVKDLCTVDRKADEVGLIRLAETWGIPFRVFTPESLSSLQGIFSSSNFVNSKIGVDNVCERAALCGCADSFGSAELISGNMPGRVIVRKQVFHGITVALAEETWAAVFSGQKPGEDDS